MLDLNKNTLEEFLRIPDLAQLGEQQAQAILDAFTTLGQRPQLPLVEEFSRADRKDFDRTVLGAFGMADRVDALYGAILRLVENRRGR